MNRSHKFGIFALAIGLLFLLALNRFSASIPVAILDAMISMTVADLLFGVGLVLKKRVEWLWQDNATATRPIRFPAMMRQIWEGGTASSSRGMAWTWNPTPAQVLGNFIMCVVASISSFSLSILYKITNIQIGTTFLVPDALLVVAIFSLTFDLISIVTYQRNHALRLLGLSILTLMRERKIGRERIEKLKVFTAQLLMLPGLFVGLTFLYFIGADNALANGNTALYDVMITTSFVMAQATQTQERPGPGLSLTKSRKIPASAFFLLGGLVMMLNLFIPLFIHIPYNGSTLYQQSFFNVVVGGGMIGEFMYLMGFFAIGTSCVESKVKKEMFEFRLIRREELFDMWASRFRNIFKISRLV